MLAEGPLARPGPRRHNDRGSAKYPPINPSPSVIIIIVTIFITIFVVMKKETHGWKVEDVQLVGEERVQLAR